MEHAWISACFCDCTLRNTCLWKRERCLGDNGVGDNGIDHRDDRLEWFSGDDTGHGV